MRTVCAAQQNSTYQNHATENGSDLSRDQAADEKPLLGNSALSCRLQRYSL